MAAQGVGGLGAPVVMVIFDEFSSASLVDARGRIDASRYPNLARLAGEGTWYPNATTVADRTQWAVPALLTGRVPPESALPIAADHPRSLFSLLGDRYRFNVEEPITDVCPQRLCGEEERPSAPDRLRSLVSDLERRCRCTWTLLEDLAELSPPRSIRRSRTFAAGDATSPRGWTSVPPATSTTRRAQQPDRRIPGVRRARAARWRPAGAQLPAHSAAAPPLGVPP